MLYTNPFGRTDQSCLKLQQITHQRGNIMKLINQETYLVSVLKRIADRTTHKFLFTLMALLMTLSYGSGVMAGDVTFWDGPSGCAGISGMWDEESNTCTMTQNFAGNITLLPACMT